MGAENSILEGCQWGDEVPASGLEWDLQHAVAKGDCPITVFEPQKNERKYNDMIEKLAKALRMLRHPSILHYIGAGRTSDNCFLVTEQVTPLGLMLDSLSPMAVCAGLSDILDAVMFLHDKAGISHNNICVEAVFVAKDGSWRLGEMQHACPFTAATREFLDSCRAYRNQASLPPEETQDTTALKPGEAYARDVYSMGVFIEQLSEHLKELREYNKVFELLVGRCLSADPSKRPRAVDLKNSSLFQNDFIHILNFVRNAAVKSLKEKAEFFSGLLPKLLALPEELIAHRLAVPLLSRFVLLDKAAVAHVVPHLLTPKPNPRVSPTKWPVFTPVLSGSLFKAHVIPELQRIMLVHDAHIRLVLLEHFSRYAHLFDTDILRAEIYPQILLGLRDSDDAIVAASLRALADLVPLLGGDFVVGGQRKTYFFQGAPKFSKGKMRPHKMQDIIKPVGSVKALSNGKPLLPDRACEEIKHKERHHRREQARQRKEERRKTLSKGEEVAHIDPVIEISATCAAEGASAGGSWNSPQSDGDKGNNTFASGEMVGKEIGVENDRDKESVQSEDDDDDDDVAEEESTDEWQHWGGKGNSDHKSEIDIISDEIEAELKEMSGTQNQQNSNNIVPTLPDNRHSDSSVISERSEPVSDTKHINDINKISRSQIISSSRQPLGKSLKLGVEKTVISSAQKKTFTANELGTEYEIKRLDVAATKEVDFFADMMPNIKIVGDQYGLVIPSAKDKDGALGSGAAVVANRFALTETAAEVAGDWGSDGDWSDGW